MNRKAHVWGLLAAEARRRGGPISMAAACHTAVGALPVDGAMVVVIAPGDVHLPVFATDALGWRLGDLQSTLGQGPGLQSYHDRAPVLISDLDTDDERWPVFGGEAADIGVEALFVFPLLSGTVPIGVFEMYRASPGPMTGPQLGDALVLADIMAVLLLSPDSHGDEQFLSEAISSERHAEVYQATGMLSVQLGVSLPDALARLRGHAFASGQPISVVAREIVFRRLNLEGKDSDD